MSINKEEEEDKFQIIEQYSRMDLTIVVQSYNSMGRDERLLNWLLIKPIVLLA